MATALIVVLISVGVAEGLISGAHFSGSEQDRSQADQIAQQDQERLRGLSSKQLSALGTAQTYAETLGKTNYQVSSQATLMSTTGSTPCTTTGPNAVAYYHTVSTVSWTDSNGSQSISEGSVISPPIGGALLAPVVDQTNTPLSGVTVNAVGQSAGGDNESGITGTNGCVTFTGLNPDTYNLSFTETGYVDKDGSSPVADTASVTSSGTARPTNNQEVMGLAGQLTGNFSTIADSSDTSTTLTAVTNQNAGAMAWYGSGGTSSMTTQKSVVAGSGGAATFTTTALFPFAFLGPPVSYANNYYVWAGQCMGEEPPSGYDTYTVTPGSNQTITVQEPSLNLTVNYGGTRVAPTDVTVTYNNTSPACSDKWVETIRTSAATSTNGVLAYPGVPFATSATSGSTASASGQTGSLTICADYYKSRAWHMATTSGVTTASSFVATTPTQTSATVNIPTTTTTTHC